MIYCQTWEDIRMRATLNRDRLYTLQGVPYSAPYTQDALFPGLVLVLVPDGESFRPRVTNSLKRRTIPSTAHLHDNGVSRRALSSLGAFLSSVVSPSVTPLELEYSRHILDLVSLIPAEKQSVFLQRMHEDQQRRQKVSFYFPLCLGVESTVVTPIALPSTYLNLIQHYSTCVAMHNTSTSPIVHSQEIMLKWTPVILPHSGTANSNDTTTNTQSNDDEISTAPVQRHLRQLYLRLTRPGLGIVGTQWMGAVDSVHFLREAVGAVLKDCVAYSVGVLGLEGGVVLFVEGAERLGSEFRLPSPHGQLQIVVV
eukprot:PhF_6_TR567/c0_g1_i1/m.566